MRKTAYILLLGITMAMNALAQKDPSEINSTGGSATYKTITYDWSVGEMAAVETFAIPELTITQGYLQPYVLKGTKVEQITDQQKIVVFPDYGKQTFTLVTSFEKPGKLNYQLIDLNGRILRHEEVKVSGMNFKQSVDLTNYPHGMYLLKTSYTTHDESVFQSFKIQK
jgi:hypothetical protein